MRFSSAATSILVTLLLVSACDESTKYADPSNVGGSSSGTGPNLNPACQWVRDLTETPPGTVSMVPPAAGELDVFAQAKALGRGINLGNSLDAPAEGAWGPRLGAFMFEAVKRQGFDSVRIPVKWSSHAPNTSPFTIDPKFFDRVDWAIAQGLTRGLKVVVDMHHFGNTGEEGMYDQPAKYHDKFIALWRQIADHYKNYPKELYLEVLNEPRDKLETKWNAYMVEAVAAIRETNPGRTLIVGGGDWNKYPKLKGLDFPDANIIATFHYYNPYCFTHGNQFWEPICKAPAGVDEADVGTAGWPLIWPKVTTDPVVIEQTKTAARDLMTANIQEAVAWSTSANRPLYMGEFGATASAKLEDRAAYVGALVKLAQKYGFGWAYWEFTSDMGVWDATICDMNPTLLAALKGEPDSTTGVLIGGGSTGAGGATSTGTSGTGGTTGSGGATGSEGSANASTSSGGANSSGTTTTSPAGTGGASGIGSSST